MKRISSFTALCLLALLAAMPTAQAQERFTRVPVDQMTPDQKTYFDQLMAGPVSATGSAAVQAGAKSVGAPFNVYLRSPQLAQALRQTGEQLRFHSSLPARLNEFAIIIVGQHWGSQYEWYAHTRLALKAGLDPKIPEQLAKGERPQGMGKEETAIYNFSRELLDTHQVSDEHYAAVKDLFGEQGVVDLMAVSGYYVMVSMMLNVNRTPLPAGAEPAFPSPAAATKTK